MTTTAIVGARVFDGRRLLDGPTTVVLDDDRHEIVAVGPHHPPLEAALVEAPGCTLLPGLIDAHVHLGGAADLAALAAFGVTTALDMGCWPASLISELAGMSGLPDFRTAGAPGVAPDDRHARLAGFPADAVIASSSDAHGFVEARAVEGADYVAVVTNRPDQPSLGAAEIAAVVEAAHARGLMVVARVAGVRGLEACLDAGVDVLTQLPRAVAPSPELVARAAETVQVPALSALAADPAALALGMGAVRALHEAGAPLLAGTDANSIPGVRAHLPHGSSLHDELALLVECGLTPVQALRAATRAPARAFGLADRGRVKPGLRSDLLLVDGDPTQDIAATRAIRRVWLAG